MTQESRCDVFVSHITEHAKMAGALKDCLVQTFGGSVNVFVSSYPRDLKGGEEWVRGIIARLQSAKILVIIANEESIRRPWINFEAGAAMVREIRVITVCHSGLRRSKLPLPYSVRQNYEASDPDHLKLLIHDIRETTKTETQEGQEIAKVCAELYSRFADLEREYSPRPIQLAVDLIDRKIPGFRSKILGWDKDYPCTATLPKLPISVATEISNGLAELNVAEWLKVVPGDLNIDVGDQSQVLKIEVLKPLPTELFAAR